MKNPFKIIAVAFAGIALFFTVGYFFLQTQGKDLLVQALERQLQTKITFTSFQIFYPLTIKISEVKMDGYGTARELKVSPSLLRLLSKQVYFSRVEIIDPVFIIRRDQDSPTSWIPIVHAGPVVEKRTGSSSLEDKKASTVFSAQRIIMRNGHLTIFESAGNEARFFAELKGVQADIKHFSFPFVRPSKTEFSFQGKLSGFEGRFSGEEVKVFGWADFYQKDLLAKLQLRGMDQELGLEADLRSVKNDMTVKGKMNLAFQAKTSARKTTTNFSDLFAQAMQSSGMNIDLDFQFRTKMDDFQMSQIAISGSIKKNEANSSSGAEKTK